MSSARTLALLLSLFAVASCHDFAREIADCVDAGACVSSFSDGGEPPDSGMEDDAGVDAGVDAGTDAGVDAGVDAGIRYALVSSRFAPLTPLSFDGGVVGYRLLESTLSAVQTVCSADGGVCVTGALEP